jgi:hypothetical protein
MNSEKVVKYPEACVCFRVTFLIELKRILTSSIYLFLEKTLLPAWIVNGMQVSYTGNVWLKRK